MLGGAYALNDVCDQRVDTINAPQRPLPAGRLTRRVAGVWAGMLFVAGLAMSWSQRPAFVAVLAALAAGLALYDVFSKRLGWGKPVAVGALTAAVYPLAIAQVGTLTGDRWPAFYAFAPWLFLTAFGYEILKDLRDVAGDGAAAQAWVADRADAALRAARLALAAGGLVLLAPALLGCGWVYAVLVLPAVGAALATYWLSPRQAMASVYAECVIVGIAATADLLIIG